MTTIPTRTVGAVAEDKTRCALCGSRVEACAAPLTRTPAPTICQPAGMPVRSAAVPLRLSVCGDCGHVQLATIIDRRFALGRALTADSLEPTRRRAAAAFAEFVLDHAAPADHALITEIGCNDGALLDILDDKGYRVQGLEPAVNVAGRAMAKEYPTYVGQLTPEIADSIVEQRSFADVIIAREAFAETDNPAAFALGAKALLRPGGVFVFEAPAIHEIVRLGSLDGISHQACQYFAAQALSRFFDACDMVLTHLAYPTAGQARLRGVVRLASDRPVTDPTVAAMIAAEDRDGGLTAGAIDTALRVITAKAQALARTLCAEADSGRTVAGLGLTAEAVTWLHLSGLGADVVSAIHTAFDDLVGMTAPGTDIPIVDAAALEVWPPDHLLLLDWRFADEAGPACAAVRRHGGRVTRPFAIPDAT